MDDFPLRKDWEERKVKYLSGGMLKCIGSIIPIFVTINFRESMKVFL
ncbi:hypothetical protein GCWU000341_01818 [Oribacterium sp. oral taxon 078 str. F0262]|nr:hypothetical protein GCWU000341_01818 [Oribacterium sp. oral taxon 078 str. F0262]